MRELLLTVVSPEAVQRRHYFLEMINDTPWIWGIRIACVFAAATALVIYRKMKGRDEE